MRTSVAIHTFIHAQRNAQRSTPSPVCILVQTSGLPHIAHPVPILYHTTGTESEYSKLDRVHVVSLVEIRYILRFAVV